MFTLSGMRVVPMEWRLSMTSAYGLSSVIYYAVLSGFLS